jgi:hypothetical protein
VTVSAASFNTPFEALFDRTAWLRQRLSNFLPGAGPNLGTSFLLAPHAVSSVNFSMIAGPFGQQQTSVASAGSVLVPIPRPPTGELLTLRAGVLGVLGHAALPGTMPSIALYRQNIDLAGSGTLVATEVDGSATVGAYETGHLITMAANHTLVANEFYYVEFRGETGSDSEVGLFLAGFALIWDSV